jgi:amino acid permease
MVLVFNVVFMFLFCQTIGTVWTASAHIITAVIGSGVLSLAWAVAQLGWVAGPTVMFLFSFVTYYTSTLLSACYRSGDSVTGKRNYTYMDAVQANLGNFCFNLISQSNFIEKQWLLLSKF